MNIYLVTTLYLTSDISVKSSCDKENLAEKRFRRKMDESGKFGQLEGKEVRAIFRWRLKYYLL